MIRGSYPLICLKSYLTLFPINPPSVVAILSRSYRHVKIKLPNGPRTDTIINGFFSIENGLMMKKLVAVKKGKEKSI